MSRTATVNPAGYEAPMGLTADPVIFTVVDGRLAVLLARRKDPPMEGLWALPGGFVDPSESSAATAGRKLTEKTGLPAVCIEQLGVYDEPGRDPRGWVISVAYVALVPAALLAEQGADADAAWFPVDELPELPFDHDRIVGDGVGFLRERLWRTPIARGLLESKFTMRQAAEVFAAVDGRTIKRLDNFTRDLTRGGMVSQTGEVAAVNGSGGPRPRLYSFTSIDAD